MEIVNIKDDLWRMNPPKVITFVGPRGVGKTSLLASMYQEFKNNCVRHLALDDQKTAVVLNRAHGAMVDMLEEKVGTIISAGRGIEGSSEKTEFCFKISGTERNIWGTELLFEFPLKFVDLPGKWYEEGNHEKEIGDTLLNSSVSFLVVDAPALMGKSKHNRQLNKTNLIYDVYNTSAHRLATQKHMVVIVLTRCEAWTRTGKTQELQSKFYENYQSLIDMLRSYGIKVMETWVNTLGGAHFVKMDVERVYDREVYSPKFMCIGGYTPENCEQPLVYALEHIASNIKREIQEQGGDWWNTILTALGIKQDDLAENVINRALSEIKQKVKHS